MFSVYLLIWTFKILFIILRWNILWMLIAWRGLFFPSWILLAAFLYSRFLPMVCRISFWARRFYLLSFSLLCLPPPWLVVFSVVSIQVSGVSSPESGFNGLRLLLCCEIWYSAGPVWEPVPKHGVMPCQPASLNPQFIKPWALDESSFIDLFLWAMRRRGWTGGSTSMPAPDFKQ